MEGSPTNGMAPAPAPQQQATQPFSMQWQGMPMLIQGSGGQDSAFMMQQMQMQQQMALQMQMLQMMQQQMAMAGVQPMMQIPQIGASLLQSTAPQAPAQAASPPPGTEAASITERPVVPPKSTAPATVVITEVNNKPTAAEARGAKSTLLPSRTTTAVSTSPARVISKPTNIQKSPGDMFCRRCKYRNHNTEDCWFLKLERNEEKVASKRARSPSPDNYRRSDSRDRTKVRRRSRSRDKSRSSERRSWSRDRRSWSRDSYNSNARGDANSKEKKPHRIKHIQPNAFEGRAVELGLIHPAAVLATVHNQRYRSLYASSLFDYMTHQTFILWRPSEDFDAFMQGVGASQRTYIRRMFRGMAEAVADETWHTAADRWMNRTVALLLTITSRQGTDRPWDPVYQACLHAVNHNLEVLEPKEGEPLESFWDRIYVRSAADMKISLTPPAGKRAFVNAFPAKSVFLPEFITGGRR